MILKQSKKIQETLISELKQRALAAPKLSSKFINDNAKAFETAFLIRAVETALLDLFSKGKMNGTIHTCVGQELTGVAICSALKEGDWITSNHRCHGHFIAKTGRWRDLIDELLGLKSGVCQGIGGSQHLFDHGFISNGPQGSLLPVASGLSYGYLCDGKDNVSISFIGEGTMGEGNVYEAMNLSAVMELPHVIVCENNFYSQTTTQGENLRGSIKGRAESFGWRYYESDTWDAKSLFSTCKNAIAFARENSTPVFINVYTYRLNAHSKGDDDRDKSEIKFFMENDTLQKLSSYQQFSNIIQKNVNDIKLHISQSLESGEKVNFKNYIGDQLPRSISVKSLKLENPKVKLIKSLRTAFDAELAKGAYIIGEDINDPYGGAFKLTLGLDSKYPGQVISSPISEAAITGFGIGMCMSGHKTYVEIMFGDFITNTIDQIVSNASKFFHMYAKQISANVTIRTPMGGGRGYGPTHSQSLEKILFGIDNIAVFAVTSVINPENLISFIGALDCSNILIESKVDYGATLFQNSSLKALDINIIGGPSGSALLSPWCKDSDKDALIITYGLIGRMVADNFEEIFERSDLLFDVFILQQLNPIPIAHFENAARNSGKVLIIEESSANFGWGSELAYQLSELLPNIKIKRIGAKPVPIPSTRELEGEILVDKVDIINALNNLKDLA